MSEGLEDKRFSSAKSDPRFKRVPRKVRKLEIDDRFGGMFHEDRFQLTYSSDKRGRPVAKTAREDLQRYYRVEGEQTGAELVCRSRGEIQVDTSSSESDQEEAGGVSEELVHAWGEFDQSVATTDSSTSRLAVCNMDWDRVTANDIFVLLSSLTPEKGHIRRVQVFPSEYGAKRLQVEEAVGPGDLMGSEGGEEKGTEDQSETQETERLRRYQLNRLMYYYAIIETDSSTTADYLYEHCNGIEYELTGTRLDMRVVPDEVDFSDTIPSSIATSDTLPPDYHPATFHNSALQHTKVQLTWDETDPDREILNQDFSNTDIREMDFQAYLASGSDTDESSDGDNEYNTEDRSIAKFRSLLAELESTESSKKQNDVDLEIIWEPGKLAPLEETINRRTGPGDTSLTPWEEYVQKRNEKRKQKRNKKREKIDIEGEEKITEIESQFTELGNKKVRTRGKSVRVCDGRESGELELLMASDSEGEGKEKQHFNMKEVWKNNKLSEKKKRKLYKKGIVKEDEFSLDLNDSRFVGLLESPLFAPDPSDPQFHQGRNLGGIIDERKRRREIQISEGTGIKKQSNTGSVPLRTEQGELIALVRKLKNKQNISQIRKANKLKI